MKLTQRISMISIAATAAVLFGAGGVQAQGDGGHLPVLGTPNTIDTTNGGGGTNNNHNNNIGRGPNNNNNNNGGRNNNNNNNNIGGQSLNNGGLLSVLGITRLFNFQVCYPTGQVGRGNTSVNQNVNCNQS
ncbi:hypothetical protein AB0L42_20005 [Streptomyces sp. NPDC052287]|uniref:hypothetical protein n=1 Tax=unclassified Streptomyces TaxID=2593676 RepID=UPI0033B4A56E